MDDILSYFFGGEVGTEEKVFLPADHHRKQKKMKNKKRGTR